MMEYIVEAFGERDFKHVFKMYWNAYYYAREVLRRGFEVHMYRNTDNDMQEIGFRWMCIPYVESILTAIGWL